MSFKVGDRVKFIGTDSEPKVHSGTIISLETSPKDEERVTVKWDGFEGTYVPLKEYLRKLSKLEKAMK